jgi:flagellar basal body-associated protein FliL
VTIFVVVFLIEISKMMKFLIILVLFFIFIGILTGFSIFRFLFNALFRPYRQSGQNVNQQKYNQQKQPSKPSKKRGKIIDSNEGEYIDYEEIKDGRS